METTNLYRWRLKRFVGWFLPLLAFVFLFTASSLYKRSVVGGQAFVSDDAYRNLVVAQTLASSHVYGAGPDETILFMPDGLWRVLLAVGDRIGGNAVFVTLLLGLLLGGLALLVMLRLSNRLFPYPVFGYVVAALLILSPGLVSVSLSGESTALAMLLVMGTLLLHLTSFSTPRWGLPLTATCLMGFTLWIRIEFISVWILLWIHTLVMTGFVAPSQRPSRGVLFLRGINGLLILALFLLPVLAWNTVVTGVPWPRMPDMPMSLNAWHPAADGPAAAWQATLHWMQVGWSKAYTQFYPILLPEGWIGRFFLGLGAVLLLVQAYRYDKERPSLLFLLLLLLVPFLLGLFYPYLGSSAFTIVARSLQPAGILLAAYGVVRLPFMLEKGIRTHLLSRITPAHLFKAWWGAAGGLLLLSALLSQVSHLRSETADVRDAVENRQQLSDVMAEHALLRDRFISDQPGWLVWRHGVRCIDLRGEWTPEILPYVRGSGRYDVEALELHLNRMNPPPGVLVAWEPAWHDMIGILRDAAGEEILRPDADTPTRPRMVIRSWTDIL